MIPFWLMHALAFVGAFTLFVMIAGIVWSILETWEDARWHKRLQIQQAELERLMQPTGSPALDDPEARVWSWYDGKRWHTERREQK